MMGGTPSRILARHLVPNAIGVIIVSATFTVADAILALSTLSFLGLGLPPPHADWGTMLTSGLDYLFNGYWWLVYPPAVILIVTIVAFSLIGDAIRDSLDVAAAEIGPIEDDHGPTSKLAAWSSSVEEVPTSTV